MECVSCKKETTKIVKFPCASCKKDIFRCDSCRKLSTNYKCNKCENEGP